MSGTDAAVLPHKNYEGIFMNLRFPAPHIFQGYFVVLF
jgi:hypothetical protein